MTEITVTPIESTPTSVSERSFEISGIHRNTTQEIIEITEDKVRLILGKYSENLNAKSEWQTPLSILATIILTFSTANFKDSLYFKASTWESFYLLFAIMCLYWIIKALKSWYYSKNIEDIVKLLKNKE